MLHFFWWRVKLRDTLAGFFIKANCISTDYRRLMLNINFDEICRFRFHFLVASVMMVFEQVYHVKKFFPNFFGVNERSSDSYMGRDDFLSGSLEICSGSKLIFRSLACILFKFSSFHLLKGRQTPTSNRKCVKVTKNVIDF